MGRCQARKGREVWSLAGLAWAVYGHLSGLPLLLPMIVSPLTKEPDPLKARKALAGGTSRALINEEV